MRCCPLLAITSLPRPWQPSDLSSSSKGGTLASAPCNHHCSGCQHWCFCPTFSLALLTRVEANLLLEGLTKPRLRSYLPKLTWRGLWWQKMQAEPGENEPNIIHGFHEEKILYSLHRLFRVTGLWNCCRKARNRNLIVGDFPGDQDKHEERKDKSRSHCTLEQNLGNLVNSQHSNYSLVFIFPVKLMSNQTLKKL